MFLCRGVESMAIEYLSAFLKAEGHTTDLIFDVGIDDTGYFRAPFLKRLNRWPRLIERVGEFEPDVLAVSSVSNTYPYIRKLVKEIKKVYRCYTVIGGVHASAIPEHIIREGLFDAVCVGEGEEALVELLRYLKEGESPLSVKNFYFLKEGEVIKNPLRPLIENLDTLPFPDKGLFYRYGIFSKTLVVISSRGCPYSCTFCINDQWKRMYKGLGPYIRQYSPERMIGELKYFIKLYPIEKVDFEDDIFTMDKKWLRQFLELYIRFIKLPFQCNVHALFVSDEAARLLKEAGCVSVCMGVQTVVQNKRKLLGRIETNEKVQSAVALLKKYHLPIYLEYIFGLPDETLEDVVENIEFNRKMQPASTSTCILYPFLGTSLLETCKRSKIISDKNLNRVFKGEGSYHYSSFIELPNKLISHTAAAFCPILTKLPQSLTIPLIRMFSRRYLQWLVTIIQLVFLPINNLFQFQKRLDNYFKMFCCSK